MAKKTPTPHPYAHLAGTYLASCGTRYHVSLGSGGTLSQQRQRAGQAAEAPYPQEACYVESALRVGAFQRVER